MIFRIHFLVALVLLAGLSQAQGVRFRDEVFPQIDVLSDVPYGSALNTWTGQVETLLLDRYEPVGDTWTERPTLVVVHGGAFIIGSKTMTNIVDICEAMARRGYLVVSINYRLATRIPTNQASAINDVKEDFKASVRFLRSVAGSWGVDTNRIACIGSSAGAAGVLAGAYIAGEGQSGNPGFSSEVHAVVSLAGFMTDVTEIEAGEAPLCLIHGTVDPLAPYSGAVAMHQQAQSVGVPSELNSMVGVGHNWYTAYFNDTIEDNLGFLWEHLQLGMLAGLRVISAPGTLTLESTGIAGDSRWLGIAFAQSLQPIAGLGVLCLDPAELTLIPVADFATTSRLPSDTLTASVPMNAQGLTFWVQELRFDGQGSPRLLTNCMAVNF